MRKEEYTMAAFSELPFYREVNRRLVASAERRGLGKYILDIGSGTGVVTKILAQALAKIREIKIFAIEPSESEISVAFHRLRDAGYESVVEFVIAKVEELVSSLRGRLLCDADSAFFCNAIHMIEDKNAALDNIRELLHPGSVLALNTAFFEGCQPPETGSFYRSWLMGCFRTLKQEGVSWTREKVEARKQLTPPEICSLVANNGFTDVDLRIDNVRMPLEGFEAISKYAPFAEGALPGVPLEIAVPTLQANVRPAYEKCGFTLVIRRWLQITAVAV